MFISTGTKAGTRCLFKNKSGLKMLLLLKKIAMAKAMGKKGVMSLSKTLQLMLHAVLFRCAKQCPVLFCLSLFSILHSKLHISSCRQAFTWSRNTSQKQLPEVLIIKLLKQRDHWLKDTRAPFIAIRTSVREVLLSNRHRKPLNQMWLTVQCFSFSHQCPWSVRST